MRGKSLSEREAHLPLRVRYLGTHLKGEYGKRFASRKRQPSERERQKSDAVMRALKLFVCLFAVALIMPLTAAEIFIDQETALVGDLVHIKIIPALEHQELVIITPNSTYRFIGGIPENAAFVPEVRGQHTIRIIDGNSLVDSASFMVSDGTMLEKPPEQEFSATPRVRIGEPVVINAPVAGVQSIGVRTATEEFRYMETVRPLTFIPREPGTIVVWLRYTDGRVQTASVDVVEINPLLQSPEQSEELAASAIVEQGTAVRQLRQEQVEELAPGIYNIELKDVSSTLKSVRFTKLKHDASTIKAQSVAPGAIKGNAPPGVIDAFAIDPSALEFESASFTFRAAGIALYKCKEYNYTTQECYGENKKIMDLIPGQEYTLSLDNQDPLFSQTGYLSNANFDSNTNGWTTLSEGPNAVTFAYLASDAPQAGIAQMTISGANRNGFGNYYQEFNLTIPSGTQLAGINFSALWRISTYNTQAGTVYLWVQNSARTTTYCQANASFSATTSWASLNMSTPANCPLGNFTSGTNYTFRLRCNLNTGGGGGSTEVCGWDNASITVWYNDTTAPVITNITDAPDPVNFNQTLNISANVTDNVALSTVRVEIFSANNTMTSAGGNMFSYSNINTSRTPGIYQYRIYANDTNGNLASSALLNFTIRDINSPTITLISPSDPLFTNATVFTAQYNLSDEVGVGACSLNVSGTLANSTSSPGMYTTLELSSNLSTDGAYAWNITCNDTSGNTATSASRTVTRDTVPPTVILGLPNGLATSNASVGFVVTSYDANLRNCSLWINTTGSWALNATNDSTLSGTTTLFTLTPSPGIYTWNVRCYDAAGNSAFNTTNHTITIDRTPPSWSNISISPSSGGTYNSTVQYTFNISWTDVGSNISSVMLESNFSGTTANVTPSKSGDLYTYTFNSIAAGSFVYKWYAIDAAGNTNQTAQQSYTILKASPSLNLTLNGSYANMSVELNEYVNSTGSILSPVGGYLELYRDGTRINTGVGRLENLTQLTQEKRYNFTLIYNATQNYTASAMTLFADVVDRTAPSVELRNPQNSSVQNTNVTFFFIPRDNVEIGNCTILLDGILNVTKDVTRNIEENITVNAIPDGTHNWTVNCTDTSNNSAINTTLRYFTVDTVPPAAFSLTSPNGSISPILTPTFSWTQTSDATFSRYTVLVDNDVGFGSRLHEVNASPISNTSVQLTVLDQQVWYWKVVAHDLAGNSRESAVFNYTADATPPSTLLTTPGNGTHYSLDQIVLNHTVTDFTRIANCSLFVDGVLNQTNTSVTGAANSFSVPVAEGQHSWQVVCYDAAGNAGASASRIFTIDKTAPAAFTISGPVNATISSDSTPTYTFTPSGDLNFANYTVEVSDNESFPYANYSLSTTNVSETSITQSPALSDGTWYWRVIAYDLAGNSYLVHPAYTVDTTPPAVFDLLTPSNGTEVRNTTPVLTWQQTQDQNFANYTILISDDASFSYTNITNWTFQKTDTSLQITVPANITLFWKVVAYDLAGNMRNSTSTYTYVADFANPVVTQVSPANNAVVTTSPLVPFRFNITDPGTIANCSLYINGTLEKTLNNPLKSVIQTINHNLNNGFYTWYVACTDIAGNAGSSAVRNVTLNVQTPVQRFYESSPGATTFTPPAGINLSFTNDGTESSSSINAAGGSLTTMANAVYTAAGQGMIIYNGAVINFSAVFDTNRAGDFYITWKANKVNASGTTALCQSGNDNTGGTVIGATAKTTYTGTCNSSAGDIRFLPGDNLTLTVNVFKSGGTTRTTTHYWEGASSSFMQLQADVLGTLSTNFISASDPSVNESATYVEQCNVTCTSGSCLSTEVYLQSWNGSAWVDIGASGNITLNGTQVNPESLGNINSTSTVNFTLYGNTHSTNTLRCAATSLYTNATSSNKTVSIVDRTPPTVTLNSPDGGAAFEKVNVTFRYTPYDRRLSSCSLWGNWSGSWAVNETTESPANGSMNSFGPLLLDYGVYKWNVLCNDTLGNVGSASPNSTLYIAGDVAIASTGILFSDPTPVEGQAITITANITNEANMSIEGVSVGFWKGNPAEGGEKIGADKTVDLQPYGSNTTSQNWTVEVGMHDIYVRVDSSGSIIESDESDNEAFRTLYLTMWQLYYGNVTGNVTLGNSLNDSFTSWGFINQSGNIFIADSDTTNGISFTFLKALGRNTTTLENTNTLDDFEELDAALATTMFNDSVNDTYTADGVPLSTATFSMFGSDVQFVPVANSSANFTTGILWDADDSSNAYYDSTDKEDILFVTSIVNMTQSPNGLVDYEVHIPSRLKEYKGSTSTVSFYYELQ